MTSPDFNATVPPEETAEAPYIMTPELQGRLFSSQPADGPLPLHFEPAESPVPNLLYPKATFNPVSQRWYDNLASSEEDRQKFPYIMTTYRITEHSSRDRHLNMPERAHAGALRRIDPELASWASTRRRGHGGEQAPIRKRHCRQACITNRLRPFNVNGSRLHVVGMPLGLLRPGEGAITNDLSPRSAAPIPPFPNTRPSSAI